MPADNRSPAEGWSEVASFGTDDSIEAVHDVVETSFGFLAAGVHINGRSLSVFGPLGGEGRIWLSADGRSWQDVTPADTFADASLGQLVALPDGAVFALGRVSRLVDGIPDESSAAWVTSDGRTWTTVEPTAPGGPLVSLVGGDGGYLALAGETMQLSFSSDGRTFEPVAHPREGTLTRIVAGAEGFVMTSQTYEGNETPTLYASGNGIDWFEATAPAWDVGGVAPIGPDWVAVDRRPIGENQDVNVATWFSSNGLDWSAAGELELRAIPAGGGAACVEFPSLVGAGDLLVASTFLSYPCAEGRVQRFGSAHITADGTSWHALPFVPEVDIVDPSTRGTRISAGVEIDSGTLLVGESAYRATFWFRPAE